MTQKAQSLHVTLPVRLKKFVEEQVRTVGYSTKSDYIQSLVRKEIKRREEIKLEKMLLEGLASGRTSYSEKEWKKFRKELLAQ
jgi:antitoxin ParD1/3/4